MLEECNPEVAETLDADEDLCEWPDFFEVDESVPQIPMATLKQPPKLRGAQTMQDYLQNHDIRAKLEQRMSEQVQKSGAPNLQVSQNTGSSLTTAKFQSAENLGEERSDVDPEDCQDEDMEQSAADALSQYGVSETTSVLIKHKQDIESEAKQHSERKLEEESVKRNIEAHTTVAEGVRSLFITKDKKGLWVTDVIETL